MSRFAAVYGLALACLAATCAPAGESFLVTEDERGRLYVAEWSTGAGAFVNYRYIDTLRYNEGPAAYAQGVAVGDFNGDGHDDFVASRMIGANRLATFLYINDGANIFSMTGGIHYAQGYSANWSMDMCCGDFNNDGNLDFTTAGDDGGLGVYLGNGRGAFEITLISGFGWNARGVDTADFDHDGRPDLVRAVSPSGELRVHPGRGDGTFPVSHVVAGTPGSDPYGVAAGDFDNDGHADLIANSDDNGDTYFYKGYGNLTFSNRVYVASLDFDNYGGFDAYDFDGDGSLDIVAASYDNSKVYFYRGNGDGTFAAGTTVGTTAWDALAISTPVLPPLAGTPSAVISPCSINIAANTAAGLDGSTSSDADGTLVANTWDMGDGSAAVTRPGAPGATSHLYTAEGLYCARLRVTDNDTNRTYAAAWITVTGAPPEVVTGPFFFGEDDALDGAWPLVLAGSNFATDTEGVLAYEWDLDDEFADTFEDGDMEGWTVFAGDWSVQSDDVISGAYSLLQSHASLTRSRILQDRVYEGDFVFETDVEMLSGGGEEVIMVFGAEGPDTGYEVLYRGRGHDDLRIDRIDPPSTRSVLFHTYLPEPIVNGNGYHFKIVRRRDRIDCYLGANHVGGVADAVLTAGKCGFSMYNNVTAFDNVTITPTCIDSLIPVRADADNFEDCDALGWNPSVGSWSLTTNTNQVISGACSYRQSNTNDYRTHNSREAFYDGDFTAETDFSILAGPRQAVMMLVNDQGDDCLYEILLRGDVDDLLVSRVAAGSNTLEQVALPFDLSFDQVHHLKVVRRRNRIDVYLDTNHLASAEDNTYWSGRVGLSTRNTDAVFDNFRVTPLHTLAQTFEAGTNFVGLTAIDAAGQSATGLVTLVMAKGDPPAADPGGPYAFDEFTNGAVAGAWSVSVDGTASTDNESEIVQYVWNLGTDSFDGTAISGEKWIYSRTGVSQDGALSVTGNGLWGDRYCFSRDTYTRTRGQELQATVSSSSARAMIGFMNNGTAYSYPEMPYAIHFDNTSIRVCEDGTDRGYQASCSYDTWYDIRIELKATRGARYYYRQDGETEWVLLYDSNYGTATEFRRGLDAYSGTLTVDDLLETTAGATASYRLYTDAAGTNTISLTVWDNALNTDTRTTTMACLYNGLPAADAGSDKHGDETSATEGIWWFAFDASGSSDDHGVYLYEWDWDYNPTDGFDPSGDEGVNVVHAFDHMRTGTNTIAVRVSDHLMQTDIDTALVVIETGDAPIADAGADSTVEVGWPLQFDGSASADDVEVARYEWDFGDGTTGAGPRPVHLYRTLTNYAVSLVVYDPAEQPSSPDTTTVFVVTSTAPVSDAGGPYTAGVDGPPACLDGHNSTDNGDSNVVQGVASYLWDVDIWTDSDADGTNWNDRDYVVMNPLHTYESVGTYTAMLTVVDAAGQFDTNTALVSVAPNLAPDVICVPLHGDPDSPHLTYSGFACTLKAVARDTGTLTCRWDFGDGTTGAVTEVDDRHAIEAQHVYIGDEGRRFDARLTVWDSSGLCGTDTYLIVIRPATMSTMADIAVDDGLWWLHKNQDRDHGYWKSPTSNSSTYRPAAASGAIQAFEINGHRLDGEPREDPYVETVRGGFAYLCEVLGHQDIGPQAAGDPDSNGNGIGIDVHLDRRGYQTGMAMDAIAASQSLLAMAPTGSEHVKHRFFYDILTDMVDCYAWGQGDTGNRYGGWRYNWEDDADNSISQWGAIGMLAARDLFGINIPEWVLNANRQWLNASFDGMHFSYQPDYYPWAETSWRATHPSAMTQMAVDNIMITNAAWRAAEDVIADNWTTYYGNPDYDNYYAIYAAVKAMRLARPRPVVIFEATGLDWYNDPVEGIEQRLVTEQLGDDSWLAWYRDNGTSLNYDLSTAWAVMMLTPSFVARPPVAVIGAPSRWGYDVELVFDALDSFHVDNDRQIVKYEWDFDGDGVYDFETVSPDDPNARWTYPDPHPGLPGDPDKVVYVRLRVTDNNTPAQSDVTTRTITISESPHAPFADAGGPYTATSCVDVVFDGSGSFDLDPGDIITRYEWDVDNNGVGDYSSTNPAILYTYGTSGSFYLGLRVSDNGAFCGGTRLWSEWDYTTVTVEPLVGDTDRDGIADSWEIVHFGSLTNADQTTDFDKDLFLDIEEWRCDTDPKDETSLLIIEDISSLSPLDNGYALTWQSVTSRLYRVTRSSNLVTLAAFLPIASNIQGQTPSTCYSDTNAPATPSYYRVELDQ